MERLFHPIPPVFDANSKILILGSFPSVKSREFSFYYQHPQNRFWKVLASILSCPEPSCISEQKYLLLYNHIALWDVIASCTISGSSDSSIRNAVPNDLTLIFNASQIRKVFLNGNTAYNLYNKYCFQNTHVSAIKLPSTSPANAGYSLDSLIDIWRQIIV